MIFVVYTDQTPAQSIEDMPPVFAHVSNIVAKISSFLPGWGPPASSWPQPVSVWGRPRGHDLDWKTINTALRQLTHLKYFHVVLEDDEESHKRVTLLDFYKTSVKLPKLLPWAYKAGRVLLSVHPMSHLVSTNRALQRALWRHVPSEDDWLMVRELEGGEDEVQAKEEDGSDFDDERTSRNDRTTLLETESMDDDEVWSHGDEEEMETEDEDGSDTDESDGQNENVRPVYRFFADIANA